MKKKQTKWVIAAIIVIILVLTATVFLNKRGATDIVIDASVERLAVTSAAFEDMEVIPERYTGNGEDVSPDFQLSGLTDDAVSLAIIMEDLDVPWKANYTHWVIWNLPVQDHIPEAIPHGALVSALGDATQGVAFGRNRYRGPKPPFGTHRYQYHVFVLDCKVDLGTTAGKSELIAAMDGHILQYGSMTGWYPRAAE